MHMLDMIDCMGQIRMAEKPAISLCWVIHRILAGRSKWARPGRPGTNSDQREASLKGGIFHDIPSYQLGKPIQLQI